MKNILDFISSTLKEESKEKKIYIPSTFRPSTFNEYIGQTKVKKILKQYIAGTKSRNLIFPHTLIYGSAGTGKTTLARILANELNVVFLDLISGAIKEEEDILYRIQLINGGVLFLDEIHSLERKIAEKFYPIMEYFRYKETEFKPFTLIGATTELGEILKDRKPLYERFKIPIELEEYNINDLIKIGAQYKTQVFKEEKFTYEMYELLAKNSRNTPRTMIRLLEATVYFNKDIASVLKNFGILKDGFTIKDLKILKYISANSSGVGLQGLVNYLDTSAENYVYHIEPFLLRNDLIIRTHRGRKITTKAIQLIEELERNV